MILPESLPAVYVATGLCGLLFAIQMVYIFCVYNRIHRRLYKGDAVPDEDCPPLSVIIVTKDSAHSLRENLPAILEQDYPSFEVIVIADRAAGEDEDVLKILSGEYDNLYFSFIPETARYVSRKKLGIAMGIRASRHEWLVMTEPDCRPVTRHWLRSLARHMRPGTDIVLGYSNYRAQKGGFARRITLDLFFRSMRFLGMALAGHPYMGLGRNMAYRKALYLQHKGFADHLQLQRGEDDLFINAVANRRNTAVAAEADGIVRMPVPAFKRIWFEEKMSSLVTTHCYRGAEKYFNGLDTWTCALYHAGTAATVCACITTRQWAVAGILLLLWLVRFLAGATVFRRTARDLGESLCCIFLPFDLLRPLISLKHEIQYRFRHKGDFLRK